MKAIQILFFSLFLMSAHLFAETTITFKQIYNDKANQTTYLHAINPSGLSGSVTDCWMMQDENGTQIVCTDKDYLPYKLEGKNYDLHTIDAKTVRVITNGNLHKVGNTPNLFLARLSVYTEVAESTQSEQIVLPGMGVVGSETNQSEYTKDTKTNDKQKTYTLKQNTLIIGALFMILIGFILGRKTANKKQEYYQSGGDYI
ncbi:MAG: hypothetical protein PHE67_00370 [Campylobacterales bacterium]|nr:hypothetical protein [Campylobacterales bacterium]